MRLLIFLFIILLAIPFITSCTCDRSLAIYNKPQSILAVLNESGNPLTFTGERLLSVSTTTSTTTTDLEGNVNTTTQTQTQAVQITKSTLNNLFSGAIGFFSALFVK